MTTATPDPTIVHLTPSQLASRLSTSTGQLANLRCNGTGPAYLKMGSRVLYRLSDVLEWEQASLITPVATSANR